MMIHDNQSSTKSPLPRDRSSTRASRPHGCIHNLGAIFLSGATEKHNRVVWLGGHLVWFGWLGASRRCGFKGARDATDATGGNSRRSNKSRAPKGEMAGAAARGVKYFEV